jgi:hypothetical protein
MSTTRASSGNPGTEVFAIGPATMRPNEYGPYIGPIHLNAGVGLEILLNTSGRMDIYLLTPAQLAQFLRNNVISSSVFSEADLQSGKVLYCVPQTGDYYFTFHNSNVVLNSPPNTARASGYVMTGVCQA